MRTFVGRCLFPSFFAVVLGTASPGMAASQNWTVGLRSELVAVGGSQFVGIGTGYGANGFFRRQMTQGFSLEFGGAVARHKEQLLCVSLVGPSSRCGGGHTVLTGVYVRPVFHTIIEGTEIVAYGGPEIGGLVGDFGQHGLGLELGAAGGFHVPLAGRVGLELGAVAGMVYSGSGVARYDDWGRRVALQLGFGVR